MIEFTVHGKPEPQGEPQIGRRKGGKAFLFWPNDSKMKAWRKDIGIEAEWAACQAKHPRVDYKYSYTIYGKPTPHVRKVLYDEPILVFATFYFAGTKKSSPGDLHAVKPDLDKLHRAVGDALEAADIVSQDSRIVGWPAWPAKIIGEPRAEIKVISVREYETELDSGS